MTQTQTLTPVVELRVGRGAVATITRESVPFGFHGTIRPAFVVTTGTGYRATLPECLRDECVARTVKPCVQAKGHSVPGKVRDLDEHNRTHCHSWHEPSARRFAEDVLATYGYRLPKVPEGTPSPGVARPKYRWPAYGRSYDG